MSDTSNTSTRYDGKVTIWISKEDRPLWYAIKHRSEWVHEQLNATLDKPDEPEHKPSAYEREGWFSIPLKLWDYSHMTAGPLPELGTVSLAGLDIDDYIEQVVQRIKLRLNESRIALRIEQEAKTEVQHE